MILLNIIDTDFYIKISYYKLSEFLYRNKFAEYEEDILYFLEDREITHKKITLYLIDNPKEVNKILKSSFKFVDFYKESKYSKDNLIDDLEREIREEELSFSDDNLLSLYGNLQR